MFFEPEVLKPINPLMDRSCGLGMLAAGRWEPPEEVSLALLKVVTAVVSPRLWVPTAHFGYGYVFIRLMINIPIDSDCHGWPERKHNSYLNHLENQIVVDLAFWIWIQCILGLVPGGVVRVAISQSHFQLWSVQYPGYVLCISEQNCIQDGSPQIGKFVIVCLYLQSQDVWWIYLSTYIYIYIYTHYSTYFLHLDGIIKQLRSPDYMHVDGPVALEHGGVFGC